MRVHKPIFCTSLVLALLACLTTNSLQAWVNKPRTTGRARSSSDPGKSSQKSRDGKNRRHSFADTMSSKASFSNLFAAIDLPKGKATKAIHRKLQQIVASTVSGAGAKTGNAERRSNTSDLKRRKANVKKAGNGQGASSPYFNRTPSGNSLAASLKSPREDRAAATANKLFDTAKTLFYGPSEVPQAAGLPILPNIKFVAGEQPNGTAVPLKDGTVIGLELTQGVVDLKSDNARDFVVGHELSHLFSERVLQEMDMANLDGKGTEVIADLVSVHLLVEAGADRQRLLADMDAEKNRIFDEAESGDHPISGAAHAIDPQFV